MSRLTYILGRVENGTTRLSVLRYRVHERLLAVGAADCEGGTERERSRTRRVARRAGLPRAVGTQIMNLRNLAGLRFRKNSQMVRGRD